MKNLSSFCTCTDLKCPLHPANHDKGCAPCVAKNLNAGEIPSCFFKKINSSEKPKGYTVECFADWVKENKM